MTPLAALGASGAGSSERGLVAGPLATDAPTEPLVARFAGEIVQPEPAPPGPALWWMRGDGAARARAGGVKGRILLGEADVWRVEPTGLDEKPLLVDERELTVHRNGPRSRRVPAPLPDLLFSLRGRPGGSVRAVVGLDADRAGLVTRARRPLPTLSESH